MWSEEFVECAPIVIKIDVKKKSGRNEEIYHGKRFMSNPKKMNDMN